MKRIKLFFLTFCLMLSLNLLSDVVAAQNASSIILQVGNSTMTVGNEYKEIDAGRGTVPIIKNGRTLVPIRAIIEEFGGSVAWEEANQKVILTYGTDVITLVCNSYTAYLNNEEYTLDAAPEIINGRTMIPIRFVAEKFNFNVAWDAKAQLITISRGEKYYKESLKVHFIDVGQGDSVFIELPGEETMLIDAGPEKNAVAEYILQKGYSQINYVVATHPDADHITGMESVLNKLSVKEFYMPDKEHTTQVFEKMLDALLKNGCRMNFAESGQTILQKDDLSIKILAPVKKYQDNNNSSVVIKLTYGNTAFLFTGDIETAAENDIIRLGENLASDVLKVSHHGANSASSYNFVSGVSPDFAVISSGKGNSYGHPAENVLLTLQSCNAKILRTDESGTIIFLSDGLNLTVEFSKNSVQSKVTDSFAQNVSASVKQDANGQYVVYKTKTGSKYHKEDCSYLKSSVKTTVEQAKSEGLTACSKCNPPK